MAPEVYKGEQYSSSVDIYSLGLVLYTLLNNNRIAFLPPYPQQISYRDNEEALAKRLSGAPITPPCNASASLGAAIIKACSYRAEDRYKTATEFKNALIDEWNVLVQSGDNREIKSDAMRFVSNMSQNLQNTTNDMTANGRIVVNEYSQGTTVLEQTADGNSWQNPPVSSYTTESSSTYSNIANLSVPSSYSTAKSNKACRIIAYPIALAVCIIAFVLMFNGGNTLVEQMVSISLIGIGVSVLLSDTNRRAIGMAVASLSVSYIFEGLSVLIGGLQEGIPVPSVISLLSGLLLLFGGVVILTQKEVRFGGSLCVYALAVEWLFNIYYMINNSFSLELWHVFYGIAAVAVFIWSYGYKSDEKIVGVKKILHVVTYVIATVVAIQAIAFTITSFSEILR